MESRGSRPDDKFLAAVAKLARRNAKLTLVNKNMIKIHETVIILLATCRPFSVILDSFKPESSLSKAIIFG